MFAYGCLLALSSLVNITDAASVSNYSRWMADSIMSRQQGIMTGTGGSSELLQAGIVQKAFRRLLQQYPDDPSASFYAAYISKSVNSVIPFITNATRDAAYPLDRFSNGNALIEAADQPAASNALDALRTSLDLQRRNAAGGLWYYVYPNWSYLDGMYSYAPFYLDYAQSFEADNNTATSSEVALQLDLLWRRCRNATSGLLVHGYDYSKTAVWANPITGASPHVWGRSLGWYAMALVDTMDIAQLAGTTEIAAELEQKIDDLSEAIANAVDPASGAWWQILDMPAAAGNYIESSASAMFVYSFLKASKASAARKRRDNGYNELAHLALRAYDYIVESFVVENSNGSLSYNGTVAVCSLNSTASYEVYVLILVCKGRADDGVVLCQTANPI